MVDGKDIGGFIVEMILRVIIQILVQLFVAWLWNNFIGRYFHTTRYYSILYIAFAVLIGYGADLFAVSSLRASPGGVGVLVGFGLLFASVFFHRFVLKKENAEAFTGHI